MDISEILKENERRNALILSEFDPEKGFGSTGERFEFDVEGIGRLMLPVSMRE